MKRLKRNDFDKKIRIERPESDGSLTGAGSGSWVLVADGVWAGIKDMLPSSGEKLAEGINVTTRPARVRMRYREDISTDMRFVHGARVMQITAGPAELGVKEGVEFMVEDYSSAGNPA